MTHLSQLISLGLRNAHPFLLASCGLDNIAKVCVRYASKKSSTSTSNRSGHARPKHRGWKVQDGTNVQAGTILVLQRTTRFHPGLNVGFGRNGTLFAMEAGKVIVTCEQIDPNWEHPWIKRNYSGREGRVIYKKHFNVIPISQHNRFKVIERI
ncbi:LOW QUALITY PROTEIN: uncharacterized protein LOC105422377 [Pogonomyrmex barbatus]|uniref:Large ribosomal subunit protein bL27m n=1 Tax=Pogonomyrmex barbatus TaxID=144034 RepID=A0A6I9WE35_9HYME|nr:LOW QUALITY PROTEIN: uncharacterized protein LOC105422377 [Pogonomyrmex barbatus]